MAQLISFGKPVQTIRFGIICSVSLASGIRIWPKKIALKVSRAPAASLEIITKTSFYIKHSTKDLTQWIVPDLKDVERYQLDANYLATYRNIINKSPAYK